MNESMYLVHQAVYGGIAAAGFGVLFNYPRHWLPVSFASGVLALSVRTLVLDAGLSLPLASFLAALAVSLGAEFLRGWPDLTRGVLAVVGCIPMVPGSLASRAVVGLFSLSQTTPADSALLMETVQNLTRFTLTIAAMGTALVLPSLFRRALTSTEESSGNK